jgi:hypothetical protein
MAKGTRYVGRWIPRTIKQGRILAHNHVVHTPTTLPGVNGFRAWTEHEETLNEGKMISCDCGWSGLPHYKMNLHTH